jgi:MFS family permease
LHSEESYSVARLTTNQRRGFWAAWGGWALDGMDSFIFALVLVPALRELLPRSGIRATEGEVGFYGGLLVAFFLFGWGLSLVWGPIGDRFGRVRTLNLTILCYSVFTFAGAFTTNVYQLAACRLLAGVGIGGEWTLAGTFVAEEWPEDRRKMGAGYLQTGYYLGFLIAALLNGTIGARFGWRCMFIVGGLPAFLVLLIRRGVHEPGKWKATGSAIRPFLLLFSSEYRRRTIMNSLLVLVSITGLWAGSVYVPTSVTYLAGKEGLTRTATARLASLATILLSVGTILGSLLVPPLLEKFGRRRIQAVLFALMFAVISIAFGWVFYLPDGALRWFLAMLFLLGLGGANFTTYSIWLPEQYRTECRASALAFTSSIGRFVGAGVTFLVGAGVSHFHTIGIPVALTSLAFLLGMALLPLSIETRGQKLPE